MEAPRGLPERPGFARCEMREPVDPSFPATRRWLAHEAERREAFFDACDEAWTRLKSDPEAWAEERAEWDVTPLDGASAPDGP